MKNRLLNYRGRSLRVCWLGLVGCLLSIVWKQPVSAQYWTVQQIESRTISDEMVLYFVAIAKNKDAQSDLIQSIPEILEFKKSSLQLRLEQTEVNLKALRERWDVESIRSQKIRNEHRVLQDAGTEYNAVGKDEKGNTDKIFFPMPTTIEIADQLLSDAMLELQKLIWDIEAETVLLQSLTESEGTSLLDEAQKIEQQISELSVKSIEVSLANAKESYNLAQQIDRKGAGTSMDLLRAYTDLKKLEFESQMEKAKFELANAKHGAARQKRVADSKESLSKLVARKTLIEKNIRSLRESRNLLGVALRLEAAAERHDAAAAAMELQIAQQAQHAIELRFLIDAIDNSKK